MNSKVSEVVKMSFQLPSGVSVPNLSGIHECYEVLHKETFDSFAVNISMEHLESFVVEFYRGLQEPCFFILEIPTNENDEVELRKSEADPYHMDVFYWDRLTVENINDLWAKYGALLLQDGMSCFGFSSHVTKDEIYVGRYKITNLFTSNSERYTAMLTSYNIPCEDKIKTVWETFTEEEPGELSIIIEQNGKTVYDVADELQKGGLYFAERRER